MFLYGGGGGGGNSLSPFPQIWSPKDDSGCLIWYDFADASTITITGSGISQITNKVAGGTYTLTQATDASRPSWDGSKATGRGTGAAAGLAISTTINWTNSAYLIAQTLQVAAPDANFGQSHIVRDASAFQISRTSFSSTTTRFVGRVNNVTGSTGEFDIENPISPATETALQVRTLSFTGIASGAVTTYKNGTASGSTSGANVNPATGTSLTLLSNGATALVMGDFIVTTTTDDVTRQKYEGYLAWKRGLVGSLPANHPYKYSPPYTSLWTPANDPAAIIWYDFADPFTITITGAGISQVTNKINSGTFALTQSTDANRPTWDGSLATGRTVTGGTTGLNLATTVNFTNSSYMALYTAKFNTFTAAGSNVWLVTDTGGTNRLHGEFISTSANTLLSRTQAAAVTSNGVETYTPPESNLNIRGLTWSGVAGGSHTPYKNGVAFTTYTNAGNNNVIGSAVYLLKESSANITMGDFIVTADTSTAMRQKYEGYMAWKRGIFTSLDVTHPYRYRPPAISD